MTCLSTCFLVFVLAFSSLYTTYTSYSDPIFENFVKTLDTQQRLKYQTIVNQRFEIYNRGLLLGLMIGVLWSLWSTYNRLDLKSSACNALLIALSFTYVHYIVSPKTKGFMITDLDTPQQRLAWLSVYRTMQKRHVIGTLLSLLAWGVFKVL